MQLIGLERGVEEAIWKGTPGNEWDPPLQGGYGNGHKRFS